MRPHRPPVTWVWRTPKPLSYFEYQLWTFVIKSWKTLRTMILPRIVDDCQSLFSTFLSQKKAISFKISEIYIVYVKYFFSEPREVRLSWKSRKETQWMGNPWSGELNLKIHYQKALSREISFPILILFPFRKIYLLWAATEENLISDCFFPPRFSFLSRNAWLETQILAFIKHHRGTRWLITFREETDNGSNFVDFQVKGICSGWVISMKF